MGGCGGVPVLLVGHQKAPVSPYGVLGLLVPPRGGRGSGWGPHLLQQVSLLNGLQDAFLGGVLDFPPHHEFIQDEISLLEVEDDVQLTDLGGAELGGRWGGQKLGSLRGSETGQREFLRWGLPKMGLGRRGKVGARNGAGGP